MTVFALVSAKGAPGVTTLACAMGAVWPAGRDVVVAECDPAGGDVAARFGLFADMGLTSLVLAGRHGDEGATPASQHVQRLPGGLEVLCGPVGADAGIILDRALGDIGLAEMSGDVVADCGRLGAPLPGQQRVLRRADMVALLIRPDASSVAYGRSVVGRLAALRSAGHPSVGLVVAGRGVFGPADMAEALGVALLGSVPRDDSAAAMLRGEPGTTRALARSPLVAAAKKLVLTLLSMTAEMEWRNVG